MKRLLVLLLMIPLACSKKSLPETPEPRSIETVSAGDVLEQIEKRYLTAGAVRFRYRTSPGERAPADTESAESWGESLLADGNRFRLESWTHSGRNREVQDLIVSDGEHIQRHGFLYVQGSYHRKTTRNRITERKVPDQLDRQLRIAFVLAGGSGIDNVLGLQVLDTADSPTPEAHSWFKVSQPEFEGSDGGLKVIRYNLDVDRLKGSNFREVVRLWYDPSTLILRKRSSRIIESDGSLSPVIWWEVYENVELGDQVDPSCFNPVMEPVLR